MLLIHVRRLVVAFGPPSLPSVANTSKICDPGSATCADNAPTYNIPTSDNVFVNVNLGEDIEPHFSQSFFSCYDVPLFTHGDQLF